MIPLELSALPFFVNEKATRSGQGGDQVDVAAPRARTAHDDVVGQHRAELRLGPGAGVEHAGDDRQGEIRAVRGFAHRAQREYSITQSAKWWLTSSCNALRFVLWQGSCRVWRISQETNQRSDRIGGARPG